MGLEQDARLLKEQANAEKEKEREVEVVGGEDREVVEERRKGEHGWRYGAVSFVDEVTDEERDTLSSYLPSLSLFAVLPNHPWDIWTC